MKSFLRSLFRRGGRPDLSPMWFLSDSLASLTSPIDERVTKVLRDLREDGVALLPSNFDLETCAAVVRDFEMYCADHPESADYRDEHGLHERLACLHLVSAAARRIVLDPRTLAIIQAAFRRPAVVVGSLFFEKGSAQSVHRDTPAFFTNPLNHFLGVWTALEDVRAEAGPLLYYRRGHRLAQDRYLYTDRSVTAKNYFARVIEACRAEGLELVEFLPRRGDTLIWHPEMPHGGAAILDPRCSRRSLVAHYIPNGVPIYGADAFFGRFPIETRTNYRTLMLDGGEVLDQDRPRFFHNRYEGNFDEP